MTPAHPRGRVLVVEDDDEVRSALHDVLEDHGWEVALAQDGEAGLELLRDDPGGVSVVLVDLMMPRLGGAGFLKRKALEPALAGVPVIVVSAIPDMTPIPDTPDVFAVLRKPVAIAALLEAVRGAAAGGDGPPHEGPRRDGPQA
jgi:DNA-binding response OmpR family regulator